MKIDKAKGNIDLKEYIGIKLDSGFSYIALRKKKHHDGKEYIIFLTSSDDFSEEHEITQLIDRTDKIRIITK